MTDEPETVSEDEALPNDTLDFLFDQAKDEPDRVMAQIKSLEARGAAAFGAGTVLLGFTAVSNLVTAQVSHAALAFIVIAALGYVAAGAAAILLLRPAGVYGAPTAHDLWEDYRRTAPAEIKSVLIQAIARDSEDNGKLVNTRALLAQIAVAAAATEGLAVVTAVVLSRTLPP